MSKRSKPTVSEQSKKRARSDTADTTQQLIASTSDGPTRKKEAQVGIIESITLTNFMCHSNLHFEFGANVNFVIGKNGSGKSAVLTGLVIGLGGKANVTSRGSNLKAFIKEGKSFANVTVMLRNKGVDAYKPQEFGEFILVERRITVDGVSSYKIKGHRGNLVSNKKEELVRILDQFNIQVDNPVAVLNQETSRNFLNSKSSKDKYLFFLKATQLEQIKEEYSAALEHKSKIKDILNQKMSTVQVLEKEVHEWEQKWQAHQSLEEQRGKVCTLRGEFAWAVVNEREEDIQQNQTNVKDKLDALPKLEEQVESIAKKEDSKKQNLDHIRQQLNGIKDSIMELRPQCAEAKEKLDQQKSASRARELELRKLRTDEAAVEEDEKSLQQYIEKMQNSAQTDAVAAERVKRTKEIEALEERKVSLTAQFSGTVAHFEQLSGLVQQYQEDMFPLRHEKTMLDRQVDTLQNTRRNLEASRTNRFKRFGPNIPELLEQIKACREFKVKPKGPIGACFSLTDENWALAIESCLGPLIYSFCCDNYSDEKVLIRLINSTVKDGMKPSIIVSQFQSKVYDVGRFRVHAPPHHTVFDVLKIKDPVIANCLIDQRLVESVLLIERSQEARPLMMKNPPRNCKMAYTKDGDRLHANPFRYYSSTRYRANVLKGSAEEKIQEVQSELASCLEQRDKVSAQITELEGIIRKTEQELRTTEHSKTSLRQEIARLDGKVNELKNVEEPEAVDVTELEEELQNKKEHLAKLRKDIAIMREVIVETRRETSSVQENYQNYVAKLRDIKERSDPLKAELQNSDTELQALQYQRSKVEADLTERKNIAQKAQDDYDSSLKDLEVVKEKAEKISDRVDTRRTPAAIQSEIDKIKRQLQNAEKMQGNAEEVLRKYTETKKNYENVKSAINSYNDAYKALDKSMNLRRERFAQFRTQLTVRVRFLFLTSLVQRNYKGSMAFDHKKGTLDLFVQTRENVKELNKDTRSLSGGERSFSTVCFIISLWDAMEAPFRILDEFDVFMDMVNRRVSMDMMLDTAKHKRQNQFIFLTPQDMTKIHASELVNICKMPDPVRTARQLASSTAEEGDG